MTWNAYGAPPSRKRLPVITEAMGETIACGPYACKITRHACGVRCSEAARATVKGRGPVFATGVTFCRSCEIGASHRKGVPHPGAPALARPSLPPGHEPPAVPKRVGRFVVEAERRSHVSREDRLRVRAERARARRAAVRSEREANGSKWTEGRALLPELRRQPCVRCGQPKSAGIGKVHCDPCQVIAREERAVRDRARKRARAA